MAATSAQGKTFTLFMVGATAAAAGIAYISISSGKLALLVGLAALAISFLGFLKIKPQEGRIAASRDPAVMKLAGLALALGGWLIVLFGIHLSSGVGGRLGITVLGLAVSLAGMIGLIPAATRKNAIWKA